MSLLHCVHEPELIVMLRAGHWPHASAPDLRTHVATCPRCSQTLLLRESFEQARAASAAAAPLPPPGILWWRAQLRRRYAAIERINKPLTSAQIFAIGINLLVVSVLVVSQARHGLRWLTWFSTTQLSSWQLARAPRSDAALAAVVALGHNLGLTLLIPSLGVLALLGGIVLFLASDQG